MRADRRVVVVTVGALILAACGGGDDEADGAAASTTAPTSAAATTSPEATAAPTTDAAPEPTSAPTTAPATTSPPSTTPPETTSGGDDRFAAIEPIMSAFVESNGLNGAGLVIVDRDDGIVHEEYVGEFDRNRVSLIASSSKMITAGVMLRLADDGLLDLDAPVADAVDWGSGNPEITPAQLVTNSSGLVGLGPDPAYGPYVCQFFPDREIEECAAEVFQTPDDDGDIVAPDTEYRYGGVQWQVAGAVAEAVTGKTWAELIDEIYVQPCGVDSLGYTNHWFAAGGFDYPADFDPANLTPTDNPHMEGGAFITPPDYAELLLMHLRGGMCDGGRVLSEASVARAHTDRVAEAYPGGGADQPGYGFGWWVDRDTGIITDGGAYGSQPWLDLEDGYGAYLVIEADSGLGGQLYGELAPAVETAMTG